MLRLGRFAYLEIASNCEILIEVVGLGYVGFEFDARGQYLAFCYSLYSPGLTTIRLIQALEHYSRDQSAIFLNSEEPDSTELS